MSSRSLSIGEVLTELRRDFPDVTISKIRFLEAAGLVQPQRSPSGYRKFEGQDVERLRYVLSVQRDHYLPLKVIRDHLEALDRGLEPPPLPAGAPRVPEGAGGSDGLPEAATFVRGVSEMRLSRQELLGASGLEPDQLDQLEQFGLIRPRPASSHYDGDALATARTVAELSQFGIEARHLRSFKTAADREVGLIEQVVTPLRRQRGAEAASRAEEASAQLAALSIKLHSALVRSALRAQPRA